MAKNTNTKKTVDRIRLNIDTYIAGNPTGTFNYRQVSAAIGLNSQAEQKHVAMYLAELAFDMEGREVDSGNVPGGVWFCWYFVGIGPRQIPPAATLYKGYRYFCSPVKW